MTPARTTGPYIVSELLQGQTLRDLLGHGTLVTRKAVEYGIAVATGLTAAHENGIIHRDIKPENVFGTADGRIRILSSDNYGVWVRSRPWPPRHHCRVRQARSRGAIGKHSQV